MASSRRGPVARRNRSGCTLLPTAARRTSECDHPAESAASGNRSRRHGRRSRGTVRRHSQDDAIGPARLGIQDIPWPSSLKRGVDPTEQARKRKDENGRRGTAREKADGAGPSAAWRSVPAEMRRTPFRCAPCASTDYCRWVAVVKTARLAERHLYTGQGVQNSLPLLRWLLSLVPRPLPLVPSSSPRLFFSFADNHGPGVFEGIGQAVEIERRDHQAREPAGGQQEPAVDVAARPLARTREVQEWEHRQR